MKSNTFVTLLLVVALVATEAVPWSPPVSQDAASGEVSSDDTKVHVEVSKKIGTADHHFSGSALVNANSERGHFESESVVVSKANALRNLIAKIRSALKHEPKQSPSTEVPEPVPIFQESIKGDVFKNPNGGTDFQVAVAKKVGTDENMIGGSGLAVGNTKNGPVSVASYLAYQLAGSHGSLTQSVEGKRRGSDAGSEKNPDNGPNYVYNGDGSVDFGKQVAVGSNTNFQLSQDQNKSLSWNHGSHWHVGPLSSEKNYDVKIALPHWLG